ncbi:MAG: esterase [Acidobacteria bacterium]|nr:MAG: esterase [Acidobacteriota bacterium]
MPYPLLLILYPLTFLLLFFYPDTRHLAPDTWHLAPALQAQQPPTVIISPELGSDRRVTFRFRDPNAKEVKVAIEGRRDPIPMTKDAEGVWSVTTDPLEPDFYGYSFVADGVGLTDPMNPLSKPNLLFASSEVHVPGPPSLPWELNGVPQGVIHHHFYHSKVVGDDRDFYVYTPPGYDAKERYPVLYLLHGYSDDASAWTAVGRANVILDNLIAEGKAKPMLVVMPLGYGAPEFVQRTPQFGSVFRDAKLRARNMDRFREALLEEVIPAVEAAYHVSAAREMRAIAGLSMGGSESLYTGLNALDHFAYVGSFSAGGLGEEFGAQFPKLGTSANAQLRLLWIACGTEDGLIQPNRQFRSWLDTKGVHHSDIETPGMHTWMVWRRNLSAFAPLLFRGSGGGV